MKVFNKQTGSITNHASTGSPFLNLGNNHYRLPLIAIVRIIRCWTLNMNRQAAVAECRTGRDAVAHWFEPPPIATTIIDNRYNRCRQACYKFMLPEDAQRALNATVASGCVVPLECESRKRRHDDCDSDSRVCVCAYASSISPLVTNSYVSAQFNERVYRSGAECITSTQT